MKRKTILVAALILAFWGVSLPVEAGGRSRWGFHFSGGYGGGSYGFHYRNGRRHRRHHYRDRSRRCYSRRLPRSQPSVLPPSAPHHYHRHVRYPVYRRVYVEPIYETVCVGYDGYGRPVYDEVFVSHGHYQRVIAHYSCRTCGVNLR